MIMTINDNENDDDNYNDNASENDVDSNTMMININLIKHAKHILSKHVPICIYTGYTIM